MSRSGRPPLARLGRAALVALAVAPVLSGCGFIKGKAINMVAGTLASGGDTFTRDDDPELVGDAIPAFLKLSETLLDASPKNQNLLVSACSGFTEYGVAFIEQRAIVLGEAQHHDEVVHLRDRAFKLYARAKGYCLRAMALRFPGLPAKLVRDPDAALKAVKPQKKDIPLLYWTAASWGSEIALALDKPDISIDLPVVRALAERALAIDETWNLGALHEMMISIDGQSELIGGSPEHARQHFARAVALQKGLSPGPYLALATTVALNGTPPNREEFETLLHQALAIDPDKDPSHRTVTLIEQAKARALLAQIDTLFVK